MFVSLLIVTYGQQELAFYNHHYGSYLTLFLFEGLSGKFITAVLRPGKRFTGQENAAIIKRVLRLLRASWPETHIILRGDGHFSNPGLISSSAWPVQGVVLCSGAGRELHQGGEE